MNQFVYVHGIGVAKIVDESTASLLVLFRPFDLKPKVLHKKWRGDDPMGKFDFCSEEVCQDLNSTWNQIEQLYEKLGNRGLYVENLTPGNY